MEPFTLEEIDERLTKAHDDFLGDIAKLKERGVEGSDLVQVGGVANLLCEVIILVGCLVDRLRIDAGEDINMLPADCVFDGLPVKGTNTVVPTTELSGQMRKLAVDGHARADELTAAAAAFDKAAEDFYAEPQVIGVKQFLGIWARARRLYSECSGVPLV